MIDYNLLKLYSHGISILLIEDSQKLLDATKNILLSLTNEIDISTNGKEALEKYKDFYNTNNKFYDIVITDLEMPELDGISLIKKLYELNEKQNVIVVSAHNTQDNLLELLNMRINQFIVKPVECEKLLISLFQILKSVDNTCYMKINENLHWDNQKKALYRNNEFFELTKKENILVDLLINSDISLSIEYLLDEIWKFENIDRLPNLGNLKNLISRLRKKIPELEIKNVYGHGYKLV